MSQNTTLHSITRSTIPALFLAALMLRIAYVAAVPLQPLAGDALEYDTIGLNIVQGHGYSFEPGVPTPIRAPGYPFFLSIVYALFGHSYAAVRYLQALIGAATYVAVFMIARRLFEERIAVAGAILAAAYPVTIAYTGLILSETLFTFLFAVAILLILHALPSRNVWLSAAAGIFLGACTLTRPTTILFPAAILLTVMLLRPPRSLLKLAVITAAFAAVIAPWTVRNYRAFGVFLPVATGGAICIYCTGYEAAGMTYQQGNTNYFREWKIFRGSRVAGELDPNIAFDRRMKQEGIAMVRDNPVRYALLVARRSVRFWISSHSALFGIDESLSGYLQRGELLKPSIRVLSLLVHGFIVAAALAGMVLYAGTWRTLLLFLVTFLYFNMHNFFDFCPRYAVPVLPYLIVFAAAGLVRTHEKYRLFTSS